MWYAAVALRAWGRDVTPDSAEQSDDPAGDATQAGAPPGSDPPRASAGGWFWKKVQNFFIDWIAAAVLLTGLAALFMIIEPAAVEAFQRDLWNSVVALNPMSLADAAIDVGERFFVPIREAFDTAFGFIGWIREGALSSLESVLSMPPAATAVVGLALNVVLLPIVLVLMALLMAALAAYLFVSVFVAPITLIFTVGINGGALESTLLFLVYFPAIWLLGRFAFADAELTGKERALIVLFTPLVALIVTSVFFGVLQVVMIGALWWVGQLIPAVPTAVASSGIGAFCAQCTVRAVDSSITESLATALRRAVRP